ncbi:hypothetical protein LC087_09070 [Bacillus carboniphilus]|uniref:Uncharacterized protein n=1 Tax=Bacillus carboniphilus TaxID=86663 RepID=A0ABY9JXX5_9BACI|nr:hypothetical protein [Bacillus carboniphilus]WLR44200.1 hypothetical protein LC087_09070 [Bacillus carboniphilus]
MTYQRNGTPSKGAHVLWATMMLELPVHRKTYELLGDGARQQKIPFL